MGKELEKKPYIYAIWLEGVDAHKTVDKFSDIDFWIDTDNDKIDQTWNDIKLVLQSLGTIDFEYEQRHGHPKIRQKFFHLKGTSKYLIIDICLEKHSREFVYKKDVRMRKLR